MGDSHSYNSSTSIQTNSSKQLSNRLAESTSFTSSQTYSNNKTSSQRISSFNNNSNNNSNNGINHPISTKPTETTKRTSLWITGRTTPFLHDFVQLQQIGVSGQYGITYECMRKSDGKSFAVKYLTKNRIYSIDRNHRDKYLQIMRNEINHLKLLKHKNIINLEGIYEDDDTLYIIMEQCKGGELFERICKRKRYSEKETKQIIKELLSALQYMHKNNIIHCDLKPDNILFLTKKEDSPIKIIDFGMSKYLSSSDGNYLNDLCGTPYYTAPEVIQQKYNHSCDLWSVGVILYVMIYGYPPFYVNPATYTDKKKGVTAIYHKIINGFEPIIKNSSKYGYGPWFSDHVKTSKELRDLISKLLEKNIEKRYTAKDALNHPWITNNNICDIEIHSRNTHNNWVQVGTLNDIDNLINIFPSNQYKFGVPYYDGYSWKVFSVIINKQNDNISIHPDWCYYYYQSPNQVPVYVKSINLTINS